MKAETSDYRNNRIILLFLGLSVGFILSSVILIFILRLSLKHCSKKKCSNSISDIELFLPEKESFKEINRICGRVSVEDKIAESEKLNFTKVKQHLCANNNTFYSENMRRVIPTFGNRNNESEKPRKSYYQKNNENLQFKFNQSDDNLCANQRFSPLCSSSPLPKHSTDDTFDVNLTSKGFFHSCDFDTFDYGITKFNICNSRKTRNNVEYTVSGIKKYNFNNFKGSYSFLKNSSNSNNAVLNHISTDTERNNLEKETTEVCDLFDPAYAYEDFRRFPECDDIPSNTMETFPMCCQGKVRLSKIHNSSYEILCESFGKTGFTVCETLNEQCTNEIRFQEIKVSVIFSITPVFITLAFHSFILWFYPVNYCTSDISFQSIIYKDTVFQGDGKISFFTFESLKSETIKIEISQLIYNKKNIQINLKELINEKCSKKDLIIDNCENIKTPFLIKGFTDQNVKGYTENDFSWKGRSRKKILEKYKSLF